MTHNDADFRPTASLGNLQLRAQLLRKLRQFFDDRGYLEVETPLLSHDTVVDRHLDPIPVTLFADPTKPSQGPTLWLQTSPEFAMKRLLASGAPSIYQVCKAFRGGPERGPLHNPEFTMVEWYGVGQSYVEGMQFLSDLMEALMDRGPAKRMTYRAAFQQFAEVDPFDEIALLRKLDVADIDLARDLLLTSLVEPQLGTTVPVILHDYPPSQAALAQVRESNPPVAERFELYLNGIELANGYHELLDANILQTRNRDSNEQRRQDGKYALPEDSRLLRAMSHGLPNCTGCALGFDRLVMIAAGAKVIDEVIALPQERA